MVIAACGLCANLVANAAETSQMTEEQARELVDKLAEQAKSMHQTLEGYRNKFQDIADRMAAHNRVGAKYTVYRLEDCAFKRRVVQMPSGQPRVGWVEIFDNL